MVSNSWYTVNYFRISFGKSDLLAEHIRNLQEIEKISLTASQSEISNQLANSSNHQTQALLWHFDRNVPHRFLSPWFPGAEKNEVYVRSHDSVERAIYSLDKEFITISLLWANYLIANAALIRDFCYWRLALYLQAKNPNVPDIPNKLIKPSQRNSLSKQRAFWDIVINEVGPIKCIYTGKLLQPDDYAVEHFIPYSFVSHDLIWNLIPAERQFNSKKGDKLPKLEVYFDPFYNIQKGAVEVMLEKHPRHPLLEDYFTISSTFEDLMTPAKYYSHLHPLIMIASNNGFEFLNL
jgi:hypothetical protein